MCSACKCGFNRQSFFSCLLHHFTVFDYSPLSHRCWCQAARYSQFQPLRPPPFWECVFYGNWWTFDDQIVNKKLIWSTRNGLKTNGRVFCQPYRTTFHWKCGLVAEISGPKHWRVVCQKKLPVRAKLTVGAPREESNNKLKSLFGTLLVSLFRFHYWMGSVNYHLKVKIENSALHLRL